LVNVDESALRQILNFTQVSGIQEDHLLRPLDYDTNAVMHVDVAWNSAAFCCQGLGQVVAVLDTGVQDSHPYLTSDGSTSRVIASTAGCFSGDGASTSPPLYSNCPGDVAGVTGSMIDGEACYNYPGYPGCWHGTHIAGIAGGNGTLRRAARCRAAGKRCRYRSIPVTGTAQRVRPLTTRT
jgi:hypothetical protein